MDNPLDRSPSAPTASPRLHGTTDSPHVTLLPYAADVLACLADSILREQSPPDLERVVVLLPEEQVAPRLRRLLLKGARNNGIDALLGPRIHSLRGWLSGHPLDSPSDDEARRRDSRSGPRLVGDHKRELMLVAALRDHQALFRNGNPWSLADSLLALFDELTLNNLGLPEDLEEFTHRLAAGYGLHTPSLGALEFEARLVHTLWHAWHAQMGEEGWVDRNTAHLFKLASSLKEPGPVQTIYLAGFDHFDGAELDWLSALMDRGTPRVRLFLHGDRGGQDDRHPDSPVTRILARLGASSPHTATPDGYTRFLEEAFGTGGPPIAERAKAFAAAFPHSPAQQRLGLLAAGSAEEEARAVELQVRWWLHAGCSSIGIVTENRRLARRVRALLERAGITLEDGAGWALSTTSAAAALERWLECVEEDFPHQAMLDLLKSPFLGPIGGRNEHLAVIYRLEQDIILHENIGRGLARYRTHIDFRRHRLPEGMGAQLTRASDLLADLGRAAAPLAGLTGGHAHRAHRLLSALFESLERLGMDQTLMRDAAGARLIQELEAMEQAVGGSDLRLTWGDFRTWLGRTLERFNFRPHAPGYPVQLMALDQSHLGRFDGLIIAGCEREYLPGAGSASPFFNDAVRRDLGLATAEEHIAGRLHRFRRLLEAAPRVLLTRRREQDGEPVLASPWTDLLESFHTLAYGGALHDARLAALLAQPSSEMVEGNDTPVPEQTMPPSPPVDKALVPNVLSVSAYQQLVDCPYLFFGARCLGLAPPEGVREALEKSDYGERVHRCLEAFHSHRTDLPGPFDDPLTPQTRDEAIRLLERITHEVFADDLEDNFLHRGWVKRWQALIPVYADWQLSREQDRWRVADAEVNVLMDDGLPGVSLRGRLDRVDGRDGQLAIVDYKTGGAAKEQQVLSGESVQLPVYAVLAEHHYGRPVARVEYLVLDRQYQGSKSALEDEALQTIKEASRRRLKDLMEQLGSGAGLPAWGDEETCGRCPMAGVCRRETWNRDGGETPEK